MTNTTLSNRLNEALKFESKKQKIFSKFNFLSTHEMRDTLNRIIAELRNIELKEAKRKHYVRPNEYQLFIERMGIV